VQLDRVYFIPFYVPGAEDFDGIFGCDQYVQVLFYLTDRFLKRIESVGDTDNHAVVEPALLGGYCTRAREEQHAEKNRRISHHSPPHFE